MRIDNISFCDKLIIGQIEAVFFIDDNEKVIRNKMKKIFFSFLLFFMKSEVNKRSPEIWGKFLLLKALPLKSGKLADVDRRLSSIESIQLVRSGITLQEIKEYKEKVLNCLPDQKATEYRINVLSRNAFSIIDESETLMKKMIDVLVNNDDVLKKSICNTPEFKSDLEIYHNYKLLLSSCLDSLSKVANQSEPTIAALKNYLNYLRLNIDERLTR